MLIQQIREQLEHIQWCIDEGDAAAKSPERLREEAYRILQIIANHEESKREAGGKKFRIVATQLEHLQICVDAENADDAVEQINMAGWEDVPHSSKMDFQIESIEEVTA